MASTSDNGADIGHGKTGGNNAQFPPGFQILLVEDNPADVDLIQESFSESTSSVNLDVAKTGEEALDYLTSRQENQKGASSFPQLILLDLNLPGMNGRQVITEIKERDSLRHIPIMILSSSSAESDILESYALGASCYLSKPIEFDAYRGIVRGIEQFWFNLAKLPRLALQTPGARGPQ